MDGRARLAVGGAATVFVSVAVVCAVAVTNASALADTAGTPVAFTQIDVPLATPRPATPAPTAAPAPVISNPTTTVADPEPSPETVPAPEPEEVALPAPVQAPTAPAPAPVASAPAPEQGVKSSSSRGWERLIRWARSNGWTDAEIGRWFARNRGSISDWKAFWQSSETPAYGAGTPSVSDQWSRDGLKKDQSPSTPSERD